MKHSSIDLASGLNGFGAIEIVYLTAKIQRCIVSDKKFSKYVFWKQKKEVA